MKSAQTAVLVAGHGSREPQANREFKKLVRQFAARNPSLKIVSGFLELASPSLEQALESLSISYGRIIVLPLFLFAAGHMKRDIPQILKTFRQNHPEAKVKLAKELGPDPLMAELAYERAKPYLINPSETSVLIVGRGAKNLSAQRDFKRIAGLFARKGKFKTVQHCFFDVAHPSFEEALEKAAFIQPQRLLIVPYLLFKGKLILKIAERMKLFSKRYPSFQVRITLPLGLHPILIRIMRHRLGKLE